MRIFQQKLTSDLAWTMASFCVLAASGILINILILALRGTASLGVFNMVYALYIITAQIAVFGLHYSALRYAALHSHDPAILGRIMLPGAIASFVLGLAASSVLYLTSPYIGTALESQATGVAVRYAAFGLVFFPLNKFLVAFINGLRHMRCFALLQSARYILVFVWVAAIALSSAPFEWAMLCFLIAEVVTVVAAIAYLSLSGSVGTLTFEARWLRQHFDFGLKSFAGGTLTELNSRIDVLLVGIFLSDHAVGVYSFAAMLYDGLFHILAMVRINFNPVIVASLRDADWHRAEQLLGRSRVYIYPAMLVLSLLVLASHWLASTYIVPQAGLEEGMPALMVLLGGLVAMAGLIPFDNLLMMSGYPGMQSIQNALVVLLNTATNLALVPILGIEGAAIGTVVGYAAGLGLLVVQGRRLLGWNLITNRIVTDRTQ